MDFLKGLGLVIEPSVKVGDLLTAISILIGLIGAWISLFRFRRTVKEGYYSELDDSYAEILRAGLDTPYLRTPARIADDADARLRDYLPFADGDLVKRARYDTYAYMVWNFIETVHDRCVGSKRLRKTWAPVIRAEDALHRGWFLAHDEAMRQLAKSERFRGPYQFCDDFRSFVVERQWDRKKWAYRGKWRAAALRLLKLLQIQ
jgi:hypothetical protein